MTNPFGEQNPYEPPVRAELVPEKTGVLYKQLLAAATLLSFLPFGLGLAALALAPYSTTPVNWPAIVAVVGIGGVVFVALFSLWRRSL